MIAEVDVRELVGHPGVSKRHAMDEPVAGMATEVCRVPDDRGVTGHLLMEGVVEGVLVTGGLSCVVIQTCVRCLKPSEVDYAFDVRELFAPGAVPGDDEYPLPAEGFIDLEPMIRDSVLPIMPFSPLCMPECLGLCPRCGGDRNVGECSCPEETVDERWGALAHISFPDFDLQDEPPTDRREHAN
jgi:uncharacterized protein